MAMDIGEGLAQFGQNIAAGFIRKKEQNRQAELFKQAQQGEAWHWILDQAQKTGAAIEPIFNLWAQWQEQAGRAEKGGKKGKAASGQEDATMNLVRKLISGGRDVQAPASGPPGVRGSEQKPSSPFDLSTATRSRTVKPKLEHRPYFPDQQEQAEKQFQASLPELTLKHKQKLEEIQAGTDRAVKLQEMRDTQQLALAKTKEQYVRERDHSKLMQAYIEQGIDPKTASGLASKDITDKAEQDIAAKRSLIESRTATEKFHTDSLNVARGRLADQERRTDIMAKMVGWRQRKEQWDKASQAAEADLHAANTRLNQLLSEKAVLISTEKDPKELKRKLDENDEQAKEMETKRENAINAIQKSNNEAEDLYNETQKVGLTPKTKPPLAKAAAAGADDRGITVGSQVEYKGKLITVDEIKEGHITKWH